MVPISCSGSHMLIDDRSKHNRQGLGVPHWSPQAVRSPCGQQRETTEAASPPAPPLKRWTLLQMPARCGGGSTSCDASSSPPSSAASLQTSSSRPARASTSSGAEDLWCLGSSPCLLTRQTGSSSLLCSVALCSRLAVASAYPCCMQKWGTAACRGSRQQATMGCSVVVWLATASAQ